MKTTQLKFQKSFWSVSFPKTTWFSWILVRFFVRTHEAGGIYFFWARWFQCNFRLSEFRQFRSPRIEQTGWCGSAFSKPTMNDLCLKRIYLGSNKSLISITKKKCHILITIQVGISHLSYRQPMSQKARCKVSQRSLSFAAFPGTRTYLGNSEYAILTSTSFGTSMVPWISSWISNIRIPYLSLSEWV